MAEKLIALNSGAEIPSLGLGVLQSEGGDATLGVEYLDLYMLHWPWPANWDDTVAAYKAAERMLAEGRVRAIVRETDVVPTVNQIELHPNFQQPDQAALHRELGILTQAWSPIGGVYGWAGENGAVLPLQNEAIPAIAEARGKTPAQVILRGHLQEGRSAIATLDTGRRGAIDPDDVTPEVIDLTIDAA